MKKINKKNLAIFLYLFTSFILLLISSLRFYSFVSKDNYLYIVRQTWYVIMISILLPIKFFSIKHIDWSLDTLNIFSLEIKHVYMLIMWLIDIFSLFLLQTTFYETFSFQIWNGYDYYLMLEYILLAVLVAAYCDLVKIIVKYGKVATYWEPLKNFFRNNQENNQHDLFIEFIFLTFYIYMALPALNVLLYHTKNILLYVPLKAFIVSFPIFYYFLKKYKIYSLIIIFLVIGYFAFTLHEQNFEYIKKDGIKYFNEFLELDSFQLLEISTDFISNNLQSVVLVYLIELSEKQKNKSHQ